jgi:hypothetical protein
MPNKLKSLSEALQFLMVQNKEYLLAQRGKPPLGKCIDCKRDILAMELYARCDRCEQSMVCYKCVDKHDHLHNLITTPNSPLFFGAPSLKPQVH